MKPGHRRHLGKSGIELIEEATHLLRVTPVNTWTSYYVGSLPFILGLLYFWADMSRSPFAEQHLAGEAFGLALLFVWMKGCQAVFARNLRAQLAREPGPRWTMRRWLRVLLIQSTLQPFGLFLLPVGLVLFLPFACLFAFYQNVTAFGDGKTSEVRSIFKKSWNHSLLWPMQNHVLLAILLLFGLFVLLNWITICFLLPFLLKMFLGAESPFTRSQMSFLNTTFFTAMFGLTYLSVDPLIKAIYVLRCFYGESLQSGEDLKADLKNFLPARRTTARAAALLGLALGTCLQSAEPPSPPVRNPQIPAPAISAPQLDRAINQVINERKYTWRLPREEIVRKATAKGAVAKFFEGVATTIRDWGKATRDRIEKILKWVFRREPRPASGSWFGLNWITSLRGLLFALIAMVVVALAIFLYRVLKQRRRQAATVHSEAIVSTPDLADESVGADQLPEDGWIKLGRELLERGELRLAIRAYYLASLAHLATRSLITLAKFKSNRDYETELSRRGHALPGLVPIFGENVTVFDRIWYGLHEVNQDLVNHFAANVERIKAV